jgi:hypothetical protein
VGHTEILSEANQKVDHRMISEEEKPSPINIAAMQIIVDKIVEQCGLDKSETLQETTKDGITIKLGENAAIRFLQKLFHKNRKDE